MTKKISIIEKLIIISIVLNSGTALAQETRFATFASLVTFIIYVCTRKKIARKFAYSVLISIIVGSLIFLQTFMMSGYDNSIVALQIVVLATVSLVFTAIESFKNKDRFEFLIRTILFFSIVSSFFYVALLLGANYSYFRITTGGYTYNYICSFFIEKSGFFGFRNAGIYWEPGMYQIYLNLMLIYYLYWKNTKYNKYIVPYLIVVIVSTYSTTGYALCALILIYFILLYKKMDIKKVIFLSVMVFGIIYCLPFFTENINNKIAYGNSLVHRSEDLTTGISLFFKKPIIGYGLCNNVYSKAFYSMYSIERGNSNGLINVALSFGLTGISLYGWGIKMISKNYSKLVNNKYSYLIFALFLIISLNTEPISFHPILFLILGIFISMKRIPTKEQSITTV